MDNSPRQAAFFSRKPELNFQAAQLASLFVMYGLVGKHFLRARVVSVAGAGAGAALALARHDEVGIARCTICGGVRVRDLLGKRKLTCANCEGAIDNTVKAPPC